MCPPSRSPSWNPSQRNAPPLEPSFIHLSKYPVYEPTPLPPTYQIPLRRKEPPKGWTTQCGNVLFFIEDDCKHYSLFVTSLKLCQAYESCYSQYLIETTQNNLTTEKELFQHTFYSPGFLTHSAELFFIVNVLFFSICGRLGWLH